MMNLTSIVNSLSPVLLAVDSLSRTWLQPLSLLGLRGYIAWVFFSSGLSKIQSWDSTLYLFTDEYHVPFLPAELAAYFGTAAELVLPPLLLCGLLGRATALALFIFNIIAVIAYPYLHTLEGAAGYWQHIYWGSLLAILTIFGVGRFSLDKLIITRQYLNI